MITGLEIYSLSKEVLEMPQLTKNTIILFNNWELKNKFVKEFLKIEDDYTEDIGYCTIHEENEKEHKPEIKELITYRPTTICMVDNEQRFIFTVEAPFVLQCTDPYDLWFCDTNINNEIQLWSFVEFKGYKETWNKGILEVYRSSINSKFGCYEEYGK